MKTRTRVEVVLSRRRGVGTTTWTECWPSAPRLLQPLSLAVSHDAAPFFARAVFHHCVSTLVPQP